jgi:NADPH:quinone reductase-like Zn-dependent oxidoreductase
MLYLGVTGYLNLGRGYKLMQMLPNAIAKRPHTAESDFTGIVVSSQGVTEFQYGDAVCGWIPQRTLLLLSQSRQIHLSNYLSI